MPLPPGGGYNPGLDGLLSQFKCYRDVNRIRTDINNVLNNVRTLKAAPGSLVLNTGEECHLVTLQGTIAISFRGGTYNIPVEIFVTKHYPDAPPVAYVRPTRDMDIQKGHRHVDSSGMVYLPYLHEWGARTHDLLELCAAMSGVFGQDPPVYARGSTPAASTGSGASGASSSGAGSYTPGGGGYNPSAGGGYNPATAAAAASMLGASSSYARVGGWAAGVSDSSSLADTPVLEREDPAEAAKRDATAKMTGTLKALYEELRGQIDAEFDAQAALRDAQARLEADLEAARHQQRHLSSLVPLAQEKRLELEAYAAERRAAADAGAQTDPEELVEPRDARSRQLLALVAENAAIEDALYYLDQGITDGKLSTDDFLKEVRRLTRRQFQARALANKIVAMQRERAESQRAGQAAQWRPPTQPWQQQPGPGMPQQPPGVPNGMPQMPPGQEHWLRQPQQA